MILLRPYQLQMIEKIIELLQNNYTKILIVAPTGSGKTVLMDELLRQLGIRYGLTKAVVNVPYNSLVNQTRIALQNSAISLQIETNNSTLNRINCNTDIHIIDECHHIGSPTGQDLLTLVNSKLLFGFTATPFRLDKNPLLAMHGGPFEVIIEGPSIEELTQDGFLSNLNYYSYPLIKETHTEYYYLRYGTRGEKEVITYKVDNKESSIVEEYISTFNHIPGFIFCKTIDHAEAITNKFLGAGIRAGYISGYHPKIITNATIEKFKNGELDLLAACNMASEGLDIARAKLVIMARRIRASLTLFIQQIGRAIRPYQGQEASILDLVGNCYRFGSLEHAYNKEII